MPERRDADHDRADTMKICPKCNEDLPLTAFGPDRSRTSGLNVYCRNCVRADKASRRLAERDEDKAKGLVARKACQRSNPTQRTLKVKDAVMLAIRRGAVTQAEILLATGRGEDAVCDVLADLWDEGRLDSESLRRREYVLAA